LSARVHSKEEAALFSGAKRNHSTGGKTLAIRIFIADNFAGKFAGRSYSGFSDRAIQFFPYKNLLHRSDSVAVRSAPSRDT